MVVFVIMSKQKYKKNKRRWYPQQQRMFDTSSPDSIATFRTSEPIETRNQFPEPVRKPWEPGTCQNPFKPWNHLPNAGTGRNPSKPRSTSCGTHRNLEPLPGTRFLPGTAPPRPEHTEIYIVQRSHSILLLGKKLSVASNSSNILSFQYFMKLVTPTCPLLFLDVLRP